MSLITDFRFALRSLARVKGLVATVVVTLALGIGANAAIFSVVRGVLLRPLVNRDQDRLIYLRQSARGIGVENAKFSIPELRDLQARVKTLTAFGDFSTIDFTMVGLGEPRVVRAGVVGGSYFEVMGLRAERGRLLDATDDGPRAAGAAVLTHRFWATTLQSDPSVIGKSIRLGDRSATIVGVLEPCVPYPTETEIIANVVTSPHHLDATMVEGRVHRMTDLFGRLAPGVELDAALAELRTVHGAIVRQHPEAYTRQADFRIEAVRLRDQIVSPARTILLVLLAASALVFIVACSNVANLILARSVRREGELAIRAALGASARALRRTLLAESLLLCGAGAILAVLIARPMVIVLARHAARAGSERADRVLHPEAAGDYRVLPRGDAPHHRAAGRGTGRPWHGGTVAGYRLLCRPVHGSGLRQSQRRRRSARAVPHGLAGILRVARRADHRWARFHGGRSTRRREGRHRQPEPGAADVSKRGGSQSALDVDGSGDEIHRRQHRAPAHRRRSRRRRRRERRARPDDDRVSPVRAGDFPGTAVRPRANRSLRAGCTDHARHPRSLGRTPGGASGDARGDSRRGARARPAERAGVRGIRHGRADDCRRRRGRGADILGP